MYVEFSKMPKVRTNRTVYPEGWELIEPTLRDLETKMREGISTVSDFSFCMFTVSFLFRPEILKP